MGTAEQGCNLLPQRLAFLPFGRRQFLQGVRVAEPGQVGVVPPRRQRLPSLDAVRRRAGVHLLGPGGQVESQPVSRLFAQSRPLRLPEPGRVVAMTAAGQGGGAGGVEPVAGAEVLGQLGCGRERLGIEASGRGVVLLDETEFRQVEAVGGGGPVLSLDDGGETTFQGAQAPAALQLAFEVGAESFRPSGTRSRPRRISASASVNSRRASSAWPRAPWRQVEFRFEPDGLAVVVDGFLQSGLVLRGNAERVAGRGPLGVAVMRLASNKRSPRSGPGRRAGSRGFTLSG